jgi:hypothetical protein
MLATTKRWQIDFRKLESLAQRERKVTPCFYKSSNTKMSGFMKIWMTIMQQLMKIPFGIRCKGLLRIRKNALGVCTWIGVRIMSAVQSSKEDHKASGESSKGSDV